MRADKFFADKFRSRTKAAEALKKGLVLKNGKPIAPDDEIAEGDDYEILSPKQTFVSNGGYKLARGLEAFRESVKDCVFADLGASTGGFCDCLLQNGAKRVYCVDVGERQLDERLASDRRVRIKDRTNARYLTKEEFPEPLDGATSDLSFISIRLILPSLALILPDGGRAFVLFKPQFECDGKGIGKRGIVPRAGHKPLLAGFYDSAVQNGLSPENIVNAPVREKKNIEYVVLLRKNGVPIAKDEFLRRAAVLYEERNTEEIRRFF